MAASLLRLGRLGSFKGLQVNSWTTLKRGPALWFCTQTNEPKKAVKKTKAVGRTEAPDERAALLVHRTAVSFPVRLSEPGGFPVGGAEDSVTADSAQSVTAAPVDEAAPQALEPLAEVEGKSLAPDEALGSAGATENATEPKDTAADESPSSSSSDSDSDSDSDSENHKLEGEAKIRNVPPEFADATPGVNKGTSEVEVEHKAAGGVQHPGRGPRGKSEESEKLSPETGSDAPADVIEDNAASLITEAHDKTPPLQVAQAETPVEVSAEPAELSKKYQREAASRSVKSKSLLPEAAAEAEALSTAEDLKDPVLVSAEDTGEDLKDPVLVSTEATGEDLKDPVLVTTEATGEDLKDPVLVSAEDTGEDLKDPVLVSAEDTGEDLKDPVLVSAEATGEDLKDPVLVSTEDTGEDLKDPVLVSAEDTGEDLKDPVLVSTEATGEDLKDPVLVSTEATGEDLKDPVLVSTEATGEDLKDPVLVSTEATGEDLKDPVLVSTEATGEDLKDPVLVTTEVTGEGLKGPVLVSTEATGEGLKGPVLVSTEATGEDLKDPVLVSAEATGEDPPVETAAEQLEEPTAAAEPPEPEEPFDNSTYKNCQHHSYTPYTFVDLDVDMAKYRLPQPSSGRPSPRH